MPVLIRACTGRVPHLIATWRKRPCAKCGARAHVTLWSPSIMPRSPGASGECCIRCTRELRSP